MLRRLLALFSASKAAAPNESDQLSLLTAPIDDPAVLDRLWSHFSATGELAAVYRIVSVLDWPDLVRDRLNTWLNDTAAEMWTEERYWDHQQLFLRCMFPVDCARRTIDGPVDLDLHVALMLRNGTLKLNELPINLSAPEVVRAAMKSAAIWSLRSFSQQNPIIAKLCDEESVKPGGASRLLLSSAGFA